MTTAPDPPETGTVIVFATRWCPYCRRLLAELAATGVPHEVLDIESDSAAASFVEAVNNGNRTVPTVLFSDGSTRTNPSAESVAALLGR